MEANMSNSQHFQQIEAKLTEILTLVNNVLTPEQINDLKMYINASEWGLALETLCDFLYEDELPISESAYQLLEQVGISLEMESQTWELLKSQISN